MSGNLVTKFHHPTYCILLWPGKIAKVTVYKCTHFSLMCFTKTLLNTMFVLYLFAPWSRTWPPRVFCPRAAWRISSAGPASRGTATHWTPPPGRRWTGSDTSCLIPASHYCDRHTCRWPPGSAEPCSARVAAGRTAGGRRTARWWARFASSTCG